MERWRVWVVALLLSTAWGTACGSRSRGGSDGLPAATGLEAGVPSVGEDAQPVGTPEAGPAEPSPGAGEVAWLEGAEAEVLPNVREAAARCDGGDPAGCYRLANACEEGTGAPADMAHAHVVYGRACAAGYGLACEQLASLLSWDSGPPKDEARARELLARACELGQLTACAELGRRFRFGRQAASDPAEAAGWYARACVGGLRGGCGAIEAMRSQLEQAGVPVPKVEPPTVVEVPPRPEQACPAVLHSSTRLGGGPNLSGLQGILGTDLLRAVPETIAGWESAGHRGAWNGGEAGTLASGASVTWKSGERSVSLLVTDMYMQCTVQPGTGAAMLASEPVLVDHDSFEPVEVAGFPGRMIRAASGPTLQLWIADRCRISAVTSDPGTADDLRAVVGALDFGALRGLCSARDVARR